MEQLELDFGPEPIYNHMFDIAWALESPVADIYDVPVSEILRAARQRLNEFERDYYTQHGYDSDAIGRCDTYEVSNPVYPWVVSGDNHD